MWALYLLHGNHSFINLSLTGLGALLSVSSWAGGKGLLLLLSC